MTIYMPSRTPRWLVFIPVVLVAISIVSSGIYKLRGGRVGAVTRSVSTFPATCAFDESIEVTDVKFSGTGTLIQAEMGCTINIKNSELSAETIVSSDTMNVSVTLDNSTLKSRNTAIRLASMNPKITVQNKSAIHSDVAAVDLGGNGRLTITASEMAGKEHAIVAKNNVHIFVSSDSTVKSDETAIAVGSNGEIEIDHSRVSGKEAGLRFESNATVTLKNQATIQSDEIALSADNNLRLKAKDSSISSTRDAIAAGSSANVDLQRTTISAQRYAFRWKSKPSVLVTKDCTIQGSQKNGP